MVMICTCRNCIFFIASCFIFIRCSKSGGNSGGNTPPPTGPVVYIAGDNGTNPILWKNGIPDTLSQTTGSAYQVLVSGNDVYVGGVYQEIKMYASPGVLSGPAMGQYVYWKNGTQNNIGNFVNVDFPAFIAVSGTDVYYANGYAGWKNGTMLSLPGIPSDTAFSQGAIRSTFASGPDIYFAGSDSNWNAVDWKNGTMGIVSAYNRFSSNDAPFVSCMYVSGEDVYVGGMLHTGVYWKNGTPNFLPRYPDGSFVGNINSVFVLGTDVYSTGKIIQLGDGSLGPSYWKDTVEQVLQVNIPPSASASYTTTSTFVSGTDIYVAGYSSTFVTPSSPPLDSAIYWKNGKEIPLGSTGRAYSIYFQ